MKRILALLLALTMLLALTACGEEEHVHAYTPQITSEATCTDAGVKNYTCSCGDSYTEEIAATGHTWGSWEVESYALVGKPGSEKRSCTACSASETQERTDNAIANSFYDGGLAYIALQNGSINGYSLLEYASHELHEHLHKPTPTATIFGALAERFNITKDLKSDMVEALKESAKYSNQFGYDAVNDTVVLQYPGEHYGAGGFLGYVHNGGNRYTAYYEFGEYDYVTDDFVYVTLKATFEYNKADGKPNKYISFEMVDAAPDDIIPCPEGEMSEFIG